MPIALPVVSTTRICVADGSTMQFDANGVCENYVCEGCEVIRGIRESNGRMLAAKQKRERRRAKALKLSERAQQRKEKPKCTS